MILLAYGTRPEFIKIKPLIYKLDLNNIKYNTLFTGQHKDLVNEFKPDYEAQIFGEDNRLDSILTSIPYSFHNVLKLYPKITHVLVQGDTTSVLAVALSAFHHGIKVIHLEAGLRTYDNANPYPEEQNRRLVSQITDIHLCPTELNRQNLENERILGEKYVVGNTVLDNLLQYKKDCEYTNKVLITMHRRENHHWMDEWFIEINKIAKNNPELEFIIPLHPNPNVQKYKHLLTNVKVVEPMSHKELLKLLIKSRFIITDSGGLQEESSFFNKICLTCRKITERPEAIGLNGILVKKPEDLKHFFEIIKDDYVINKECPFGDGHAAEKIINVFKSFGII